MANCREGLEKYSERRFAELAGMQRTLVHRMKMMSRIPKDLFDQLMLMKKVSTKEMATIGALLAGKTPAVDAPRCWSCGAVQRERKPMSAEAEKTLNEWLASKQETRR